MITVDIDLIGVPAFVIDVGPKTGVLLFAGVNGKFSRVTGLAAEVIVGRTASECMPIDVANGVETNYRRCVASRVLEEYDEHFDLGGRRRWWRTALTPELDPSTGKVVRILGVAVEITDRKRLETKLEDAVYLDHLTGVANRRRLELDVEDVMAEAVYTRRPFSLIVVDIDQFKAINDDFGHRTGDDVLRNVGNLLTSAFRKTDTIARIGGDEFALKVSASTEFELASVMSSLRKFLDQKLAGSVPDVAINLSLGAALWQPGQSFEDLLAVADQDMYRDKSRNRAA